MHCECFHSPSRAARRKHRALYVRPSPSSSRGPPRSCANVDHVPCHPMHGKGERKQERPKMAKSSLFRSQCHNTSPDSERTEEGAKMHPHRIRQMISNLAFPFSLIHVLVYRDRSLINRRTCRDDHPRSGMALFEFIL